MRTSVQWLKQWVKTSLSAEEIGHRLTMAGLELDAIEPVAPPLSKKIVVGRIAKVEPHPDADRLQVCQVDVGRKNFLQIVCGAANAVEGLVAPVALVGAELPAGMKISEAKLRGVNSSGMLCSAAELGLAEQSEGLMVLPGDLEPGTNLAEALQLDDVALEVDLTPNRGDCLSVAGIARDLGAITGARYTPLKIANVKAGCKRKARISVPAKKECPRYTGRVIENIDPNAETPFWLREKLRRCGLRSISPVVDVTNYVMLELGQPMHAFDLDKIDGGVKVIKAGKKTSVKLLDDSTVKVEAGTVLIHDNNKPLAIAGIMGGLESAVTGETRSILLESAHFSPQAIAGRARSLGLHTDSSHRFERGVDPALPRLAIERATGLLLDIVGGKAGPVSQVDSNQYLPKRTAIALVHERINRLLGMDLSRKKVEQYLKRLGMKLQATARGWRVTPPSHRFDIERDVDLIEEVARVHGYEHIPHLPLQISMTSPDISEQQTDAGRLRFALVDMGYREVITYSFVDETLQALIEPDIPACRLANPIAADMAVMRTSLWPGLLKTLDYNLNRQQGRARIFEVGRCFKKKGKAYEESHHLAGLACGAVNEEQWGLEVRNSDFFDVKGDLEAMLGLMTGYSPDKLVWQAGGHQALHPGQSATASLNGRVIGVLGALHPDVQTKLGFDKPVLLFDFDILALSSSKLPEFRPISKYPSIRRDISIELDENIPAQQVLEVIRLNAGGQLSNLHLFDEYRGEGIDSGRKSLSLGLTLQESSRTLKEEEVENVVVQILDVLHQEFGAKLR